MKVLDVYKRQLQRGVAVDHNAVCGATDIHLCTRHYSVCTEPAHGLIRQICVIKGSVHPDGTFYH